MTEATVLTDYQTTIDRYLDCWNTTDTDERRRLVDAVFGAEARYVDPMADVHGTEELVGLFTGFHAMFPGHSFRQKGGVDSHHGIARWGWEMLNPDGEPTLDGIDAAMIDADGRITYLVGFFGYELPSA